MNEITNNEMFLKISISIIVGLLGLLIYIIKQFVIDIKEQSQKNRDEHKDIVANLIVLSELMPDVKECEEDVEKLKELVNIHGSDIKHHTKEIDKLWNRKK